MIRYFLLSLGVLAVAAALGIVIEKDPGYILLAIGGVAIETSFWLGLLLFLVLLAGGHWLLRVYQVGFRGTAKLSGYLVQRRQRRSQRDTNEGLIALIEGNYSRARQLLTRAADDVEQPLLNYLAAAQACNALGETKEATELLARAERSTDGADVAIELVQAEMLLNNGRLEECLASLTRAQRNTAKHPSASRLLKEVYQGLKDWDKLLELLPELKKSKRYSADELLELRRQIALGQLAKLRESNKSSEKDLSGWWQKLPRDLQQDVAVIDQYSRQLVALGAEAQAEELLRQQLRKDWRREWVESYGLIAGSEADKQLLVAESWLQERNNDPVLLLTLGRLSLRNQLWGKAREYFENSYRIEPGADVCAELGRLLAYLGEYERSNAFFQEGLQKTTRALPMKLPSKQGQRVA